MKSKPKRRKVELLYAEDNGMSVERAHKILAHDKKLYKEWVLKLEKEVYVND